MFKYYNWGKGPYVIICEYFYLKRVLKHLEHIFWITKNFRTKNFIWKKKKKNWKGYRRL